MKKACLLALLSGFVFFHATAQHISKEDRKKIHQQEDVLKVFADSLVKSYDPSVRIKSDSLFTRSFVRSLTTPNSFYYPFDSLQTISKLYAPDSSFRIFTWQLVINENLTRQHGAIQMKTADGSLKIFPLIDKSNVVDNIDDTIGNNKGWIGAVYYKIIQTRSSNQNYYTLLGFDENDSRSNRKIIEVLSFKNDEPIFGGRYFSFIEDTVFKSGNSRFILEYKNSAGARLAFDEDLDMIIAEHLESETGEKQKRWTYVGDGDYEGFKWKNGQWVHIEKVFDQVTPEGKAPMPSPVKDAQGNTIEDNLKDNLQQQTTEEEKETTPAKAPAKKPVKTKG